MTARSEKISLTLLLLVFTAAFVVITMRPLFEPWEDEVSYIDPAVNLLTHKGFTSTSWPLQDRHEFWAGNVPMYTLTAFAWMKVFGFSLFSARSLAFTLFVLSVILCWRGVRDLKIIEDPRYRILLVWMLLTGEGTTFCYLESRYDVICMLAFSVLLGSAAIRHARARDIAALCIGTAIPICGLQLVAFLVIVFVSARIAFGSFNRHIALAIVGSVVGIGLLFAFYAVFGVIDKFMLATFLNKQTVTGQLGQAILLRDSFIFTRCKDIVAIYTQDRSLVVLTATLGGLWLHARAMGRNASLGSPILLFGILCAATLPLALFLSGKFPIYYTWMAFVPGSIALVAVLSGIAASRRRAVAICTVLCLAAGGFAISVVVGKTPKWRDASYAYVDAFVRRTVGPSDIVYGDHCAYYATKKRAAVSLTSSYGLSRRVFASLPERDSVSVLIVNNKNPRLPLDAVLENVGGSWVKTGDFRNAQYDLSSYRRQNGTTPFLR